MAFAGIGMVAMKAKVLVLAIHPAPYRDPVLVYLAQGERLDIQVYYYDAIDAGHLEWDYHLDETVAMPQHLPHRGLARSTRWLLKSVGIIRSVDVVLIPGYSRVLSLMAILMCWLFRTPYVLDLDATVATPGKFRSLVRRHIILSASGYRVAGTAARRYLERTWGIDAASIAEGSYCFDVESLSASLDRSSGAMKMRSRLKVPPDAFVFLSVGKMVPRREFPYLVREFMETFPGDESVHLVLIGDGEDAAIVRSMGGRGAAKITYIAGARFVDLPTYYRMADCYVHAGSEPYSTAMEYAALAGLPIIATSRVGYAADLWKLGGEVLEFPPRPGGLGDRLREVAMGTAAAWRSGESNRSAALERQPSWASGQFCDLVRKIVLDRPA